MRKARRSLCRWVFGGRREGRGNGRAEKGTVETVIVSTIDVPSLAFIVPVVCRGGARGKGCKVGCVEGVRLLYDVLLDMLLAHNVQSLPPPV